MSDNSAMVKPFLNMIRGTNNQDGNNQHGNNQHSNNQHGNNQKDKEKNKKT